MVRIKEEKDKNYLIDNGTSNTVKNDPLMDVAKEKADSDTNTNNTFTMPSSNKYDQQIAELNANRPTFDSKSFDEQLDGISNQLNNRKFTYDVNADALYQQYKDKYLTQGNLAMQNAMATAQAQTGGYGNSYAASVGNQAYQQSVQNLNDVIPELYNIAYNKYTDEGNALKEQYNRLSDQKNDAYTKYRNDLSQWNTDLSQIKTDQANAYSRSNNIFSVLSEFAKNGDEAGASAYLASMYGTSGVDAETLASLYESLFGVNPLRVNEGQNTTTSNGAISTDKPTMATAGTSGILAGEVGNSVVDKYYNNDNDNIISADGSTVIETNVNNVPKNNQGITQPTNPNNVPMYNQGIVSDTKDPELWAKATEIFNSKPHLPVSSTDTTSQLAKSYERQKEEIYNGLLNDKKISELSTDGARSEKLATKTNNVENIASNSKVSTDESASLVMRKAIDKLLHSVLN